MTGASPIDYIPEPLAHAIYDLLIAHAGAWINPRERERFVGYVTAPVRSGTHEFRFGGSLGFGGKFYRTAGGRVYVGCYPEDRTAERSAVVAEVNRRLVEMVGDEIGKGDQADGR